MVYHSLLLGVPWDCAACPRPHRLAFLLGGAVGNQTPNLWLYSQIPNSLIYPASWSLCIVIVNYIV